MRWIDPVVIVLLTTPVLAAQTPDATGGLVGCITDRIGQPLPRVTVDISSGGTHRKVFTDGTTGCYELMDLPRGSYVVFANLTDFASVTRDQIVIAPGRHERRDFQMHIASTCECITAVGLHTLAFWWAKADAVVRLRITGHEQGPTSPPARSSYVTHTADVMDVWKRQATGGPFGATIRFNQSQDVAEAEPYAVGQEFVIFLDWDPKSNAFSRMQSGEGEAAAFAIQDGAIHNTGVFSYALGLDDLLLTLQTLSRPD